MNSLLLVENNITVMYANNSWQSDHIVQDKTRKKINVPGNTHYLHTNYTYMLTVMKCFNRFTPN